MKKEYCNPLGENKLDASGAIMNSMTAMQPRQPYTEEVMIMSDKNWNHVGNTANNLILLRSFKKV